MNLLFFDRLRLRAGNEPYDKESCGKGQEMLALSWFQIELSQGCDGLGLETFPWS